MLKQVDSYYSPELAAGSLIVRVLDGETINVSILVEQEAEEWGLVDLDDGALLNIFGTKGEPIINAERIVNELNTWSGTHSIWVEPYDNSVRREVKIANSFKAHMRRINETS